MSGIETIFFLFMVTVISFSGVALPGPVFAATIEKSYHNQYAGFFIALGHCIAEAPVILIIYLGLKRFLEFRIISLLVSLTGGLVLIWMGFSMFRLRRQSNNQKSSIPLSSPSTGFVTTASNPLYYAWWFTVGAALVGRIVPEGLTVLIFFIIFHWLADIGWLTFVSITIHKSRHLWSQRTKTWVFSMCSFLLMGFGLFFLLQPFI